MLRRLTTIPICITAYLTCNPMPRRPFETRTLINANLRFAKLLLQNNRGAIPGFQRRDQFSRVRHYKYLRTSCCLYYQSAERGKQIGMQAGLGLIEYQ